MRATRQAAVVILVSLGCSCVVHAKKNVDLTILWTMVLAALGKYGQRYLS